MLIEKFSVRARLGLMICVAITAMMALTAVLILDSQKRIKAFHVENAKTALQASLVLLEEEYRLALEHGDEMGKIQDRVLNKLRQFRYSDGEGYVAIADDTGFMLMHPVHAHFDQTDIWDLRDPTGKFIMQEAINIAKEQGIGVNSYYFEHPITGELDIKTSAVGRFDPWGWTLIVGVFDKRVDQAIANMFNRAMIFVVIMSCAFLALAYIIGRSLSRPFQRLNDAMSAIANGALDTQIPYQDYHNENGDMARALSIFRDSGKKILRLQNEKDAAQKAIEQERSTIAQHLRQQFGEVIVASSCGDFSRRVDTKLNDENLAALAVLLNELIGKVDAGVSAVKRSMLSMAKGIAPNENPRHFDGAFAEMLKQVGVTAQTLKMQSEFLEHSALHDALTGLANRRYFDQKLAELTDHQSGDTTYALLHVDLDRFKDINDSFGHTAGDEVLRYTATTLNRLVRTNDFVARIGGDEFVIICEVNKKRDIANDIASRIVQELRKPLDLEQGCIRFGASVGVAFTNDGSDLLSNSDLALYQAKKSGRSQVCQFDTNLRSEAHEKKFLQDDILRGLENDEFTPYFQPQMDAKTHQITGVEALARWHHPSRGVLPPSAFLSLANEMGLIDQIDAQISEAALKAIQRHNETEATQIQKLSLNVNSARVLTDSYLAKMGSASQSNFQVAFELLESIAFDSFDEDIVTRAEAAKKRGFEIEIDDFGTGRASIIGLLMVAPHRLKIDRQLVSPIFGSGPERNLVNMIVGIAKTLNIETVAEGVETLEHAKLLRRLDVDTLQGFAFAKPMPAADLRSFIDRTQARALSA